MGSETTVMPASLTVASVLARASGFWKASELQVRQRLTGSLHKHRAEANTALWLSTVRRRKDTG